MLAIVHTHYSLQAGVTSPRDWIRAAAERGYTALAIADINGLYGAVEFSQCAREHGIRPLIGAFLELSAEAHCTVLARHAAGYRQLCRLLTFRHTHTPFLLADAVAAAGGVDGLVFLCRSAATLDTLRRVVPPGSLYALGPHCADGLQQPDLWQAQPRDIPKAFIPESWFLEPSDREAFDVLRQLRRRAGRPDAPYADHPGALLPDARDWCEAYPDRADMQAVESMCTFDYSFGNVVLPQITLPAGRSAYDHLADLCRRGLERRYPFGHRHRDAAEKRLARELEVVVGNGFADYFLYVNEIVSFARSRNIPAGVRGSAAACILSYLLEFTQCCPLEHDLYFERFMNPGRRDCPDIDLDLADNRRDEVIDFCYRRWGSDHVAMVATVQFYRAKGALRDAARVLGLSSEQVDRIEEGLTECPELYRIAGLLVGKPRHLGIHCGGLLITPCPITDMTPLARARKGLMISHYEKDQAEAIGLVKMDLLGNSALSVIDDAYRHLRDQGMTLHEPGPTYDYKVNRLFAKGDTLGVYQCESPGMRQLCSALKPANPKDTAAAISLIRPGPAAAGMKEAFIRRRLQLEPVTYLHPAMADFLESTYGVMLYQEDVMKVAVHLAGYTMADADQLRRAVSKSRSGELMEEQKHRFIFSRSRAAGVTPDTAEKIWDTVSQFASYSYCKAHATVYARLAWLTARLKAHHPREFYAAVLNCHKSMYPLRVFVWDALRHGIPVFPPTINRSSHDWIPLRRGVLAGFDIVRGLTRRTVTHLLREQSREPFHSLADLLCRVPFQAGELQSLIMIGTCREWGDREDLLQEVRDRDGQGRQMVLLPGKGSSKLPPLAVSQCVVTGIPFGIHPTDLLPRDGLCNAADMPHFINRTISMMGILDAVKHTQTKKGEQEEKEPMSFVTLEDATGMFDVVLFPQTHQQFAGMFTHAGPYRVRGRVTEQWGTCTMELEDATAC